MAEHMHKARLKHGVEVFEVVIDPVAAQKFRAGTGTVEAAVSFPKIFSDAKKGLHASEARLEVVFGTRDVMKVAEIILKKGELPVTTEQASSAREQKRRRILDLLHRNGVDPRTSAPHPLSRLETALVEGKVHIDDGKSAEEQLQDVLKQLRPLLPIRFVVKELEVRIPSQFAAKANASARVFGKVLREDWLGDGSWKALVEIPGGLEEEFSSKVMASTKGSAEIQVVRVKE